MALSTLNGKNNGYKVENPDFPARFCRRTMHMGNKNKQKIN
jgi:hypothetical protein